MRQARPKRPVESGEGAKWQHQTVNLQMSLLNSLHSTDRSYLTGTPRPDKCTAKVTKASQDCGNALGTRPDSSSRGVEVSIRSRKFVPVISHHVPVFLSFIPFCKVLLVNICTTGTFYFYFTFLLRIFCVSISCLHIENLRMHRRPPPGRPTQSQTQTMHEKMSPSSFSYGVQNAEKIRAKTSYCVQVRVKVCRGMCHEEKLQKIWPYSRSGRDRPLLFLASCVMNDG